jgi:hypothetical protein
MAKMPIDFERRDAKIVIEFCVPFDGIVTA